MRYEDVGKIEKQVQKPVKVYSAEEEQEQWIEKRKRELEEENKKIEEEQRRKRQEIETGRNRMQQTGHYETNKDSSKKKDITQNEKTENYRTIFEDKWAVYQLSENGSKIRVLNSANEPRAFFYKTEDKERISEMESNGENWVMDTGIVNFEYYVLRQVNRKKNRKKNPSCNLKIIEKEKAICSGFFYPKVVAKDEEDWQYYVKENNKK